VTLTRDSTLQEVALAVGEQLTRRGIRAVLTGGACVAIYTGTYVSKDADFVLQGRVRQQALDEALNELRFSRDGDRYVHPETPFFIEFPPGPLSIGGDLAIHPVELSVGEPAALGLSPTDSCRDRLAAFYHWNDRQSLRLAVEIAQKQPVDWDLIREWSTAEGAAQACDEFLREIASRKSSRPRRVKPRRLKPVVE
jgi:hypothetical protein